MEIQEKINRFNQLQNKADLQINENDELNRLAREFLEITKQTYDKTAVIYSNTNEMRRRYEDTEKFNLLFETAKRELNKSIDELSILDVGTGSGRDIKYIASRGVKKIIGLDNSEGFIKILKELEKRKEIPANSFVKGDMLDLPFDDEIFDIIRQNASLVHIPITTKGEMLDKAIKESYRVLKEKGILIISVKKGEGVQFIDTKDGLGGRIFQMHTIESITKIIKENKFDVLKIAEEKEYRNNNIIEWINVIAKKEKVKCIK